MWLTAAAAPTPPLAQATNTAALGALLYTHYVYAFQTAGLILLVAMIGAIVLTLRTREGRAPAEDRDRRSRGRARRRSRWSRYGRGEGV